MERLSPTSSESYSPTGSRPDACGAWSFKESAAPGEVKLKSSSVLPWTSTSPTPQTPSRETGYSYTAAHVGSYNTVSAARSILLQATRARATDNISAIRIFFILSQDASPWQIIAFGRGNSTIFNFFENFSRKVCGIRFLSYLCIVQTKRDNKTSKIARELSSVGSERLPYKQRVGGSTPSAPTKKDGLFSHPFLLVFVRPKAFLADKTPVLPDAAFFEYDDNGKIAPYSQQARQYSSRRSSIQSTESGLPVK